MFGVCLLINRQLEWPSVVFWVCVARIKRFFSESDSLVHWPSEWFSYILLETTTTQNCRQLNVYVCEYADTCGMTQIGGMLRAQVVVSPEDPRRAHCFINWESRHQPSQVNQFGGWCWSSAKTATNGLHKWELARTELRWNVGQTHAERNMHSVRRCPSCWNPVLVASGFDEGNQSPGRPPEIFSI